MGKPMVINLIKNDIEVYFYARKKRIIDEISKIGGKFIPNPSDISKFTKIILTNLPNTKDEKILSLVKWNYQKSTNRLYCNRHEHNIT